MPTNYQIEKAAKELPLKLNMGFANVTFTLAPRYDDQPHTSHDPIQYVVYGFNDQQEAGRFALEHKKGKVENVYVLNSEVISKRTFPHIVTLRADYIAETITTNAFEKSSSKPSNAPAASVTPPTATAGATETGPARSTRPTNFASASGTAAPKKLGPSQTFYAKPTEAGATTSRSAAPITPRGVHPRVSIPETSKTYKLSEEDANTLIQGKLIPLTTKYLTYLKNEAKGLNGKAKEAIEHKIGLVKKLEESVVGDSDSGNLYRVNNFYETLNKLESGITAHRDPAWKRFVKNAVIALGVAIGSVVVGLGLTALAAYVKAGDTETKSMRFWQSRGQNVVDSLKGMEPEEEPAHGSGPGAPGAGSTSD